MNLQKKLDILRDEGGYIIYKNNIQDFNMILDNSPDLFLCVRIRIQELRVPGNTGLCSL